MLPELPEELRRFDSIMDAYNGGDVEELNEAIRNNLLTIKAAIHESEKTIVRYYPTLRELQNYQTVMSSYKGALNASGHVSGPPPVTNIYEARAVILAQYKRLEISALALNIATEYNDEGAEWCLDEAKSSLERK